MPFQNKLLSFPLKDCLKRKKEKKKTITKALPND
jgi:hypothetical protein